MNKFIQIKNDKYFVDKTSYLPIIDEFIQQHTYLAFSAPQGLGLSTFIDMLSAFYGQEFTAEAFANTAVVNETIYAKAGHYQVITIDLTAYQEEATFASLYSALTTEINTQLNVTQNDIVSSLRSFYKQTQKPVLLIWQNFASFESKIKRNLEYLHKWRRFLYTLRDVNFKAKFIYAMFAVDYLFFPAVVTRPGIAPNIDKCLFKDTNLLSTTTNKTLVGAYGFSDAEITQLWPTQKCLNLTIQDIFHWCGGYFDKYFRPQGVKDAFEHDDLFMSIDATQMLSVLEELYQQQIYGDAAFLSEFDIATLVTGGAMQLTLGGSSMEDPNSENARHLNNIQHSLQSLIKLGMINEKNSSKGITYQVLNRETLSALEEAIEEQPSGYLSKLLAIYAKYDNVIRCVQENKIDGVCELLTDFICLQGNTLKYTPRGFLAHVFRQLPGYSPLEFRYGRLKMIPTDPKKPPFYVAFTCYASIYSNLRAFEESADFFKKLQEKDTSPQQVEQVLSDFLTSDMLFAKVAHLDTCENEIAGCACLLFNLTDTPHSKGSQYCVQVPNTIWYLEYCLATTKAPYLLDETTLPEIFRNEQ